MKIINVYSEISKHELLVFISVEKWPVMSYEFFCKENPRVTIIT